MLTILVCFNCGGVELVVPDDCPVPAKVEFKPHVCDVCISSAAADEGQ